MTHQRSAANLRPRDEHSGGDLRDLCGHLRQRRLLADALASPRMPHALLLSGPPGVGKFLVGVEAARRFVAAHPGDTLDADMPPPPLLGTAHPQILVLRDLTRFFVAPGPHLRAALHAAHLSHLSPRLATLFRDLEAAGFLQSQLPPADEREVYAWGINLDGILMSGQRRVNLESVEQRLRQIAGKDGRQTELAAFARFLWGVCGSQPYVGLGKIDDVRENLQVPLSYVAGEHPLCVIIDDAHLLTVEAQNALLKTLEEPPSRCLILLVTHAEDELLPTIRSRCQHLSFGPVPAAFLAPVLEASGAGPLLPAMTHAVGGSYRRALTLAPEEWSRQRQALLQAYGLVKQTKAEGIFLLADALVPEDEPDRARRRFLLEERMALLASLIRDLDLFRGGEGSARGAYLSHPDLESAYRLIQQEPHFRPERDLAILQHYSGVLLTNAQERLALEAMGWEMLRG